MKKTAVVLFILIICFSMFGCANANNEASASPVTNSGDMAAAVEDIVAKNPGQNSVIYTNTQYGFEFKLPVSWKGYTIITDKWKGVPSGGSTPVETGPIISIRNPKWTKEDPYQDIPIMIFTIAQWNDLQKDEFHIGAAPIGPSELGRNSKYVFALPARYNFAFPTGYQEVETILAGKPLTPIETADTISQ